MNSSAVFSPCRKYRYSLTRDWRDLFFMGKKGYVAFCGANPSTADEQLDDPTIRRCIGFTKKWGYGIFVMVNLFGYRATDPEEMYKQIEPVGLDNDEWLVKTANEAALFICAWGNIGLHQGRSTEVRMMLGAKCSKPLYRLGELTDFKQPRHPLYLPASLKPVLL